MKALKVERIVLEDYFGFSGYEDFAFYYDEEQKKYSVMNRKTLEATKPFLDDFYLSDFQLGTWTANYFVGRIGDKYYLVDADGNCYFEEDKPFVICKNVFVQADCQYVINNELKRLFLKGRNDINIEIYKSENYNFAIICNEEAAVHDLLTVKGKLTSEYTSNIYSSNDKNVTFEGVEDGYLVFFHSPGDIIYCLLNENFEIIDYFFKDSVKKMKGRAGIFICDDKPKYSSYLYSKIDAYCKCGNVEFVWANGKSYIFSEEQVQEYPFTISYPRVVGDLICYRAGFTIFVLDMEGKEIAYKDLAIEEAYMLRLLEILLDRKE